MTIVDLTFWNQAAQVWNIFWNICAVLGIGSILATIALCWIGFHATREGSQ